MSFLKKITQIEISQTIYQGCHLKLEIFIYISNMTLDFLISKVKKHDIRKIREIKKIRKIRKIEKAIEKIR